MTAQNRRQAIFLGGRLRPRGTPETGQAGTRPDAEEKQFATLPSGEAVESPPLSDEEIRDLEYTFAHPEENKRVTLQELLDELNGESGDVDPV